MLRVLRSSRRSARVQEIPGIRHVAHEPRVGRIVLDLLAQTVHELLQQLAYFWGSAAWNWLSWQGASLLGIVLADRVPTEWGLGFAGVLALLGITYSLLSDKKTWIAAGVAAFVAVAAFALPLKLNIVAAIAAGVATGLLLDRAFRNPATERA